MKRGQRAQEQRERCGARCRDAACPHSPEAHGEPQTARRHEGPNCLSAERMQHRRAGWGRVLLRLRGPSQESLSLSFGPSRGSCAVASRTIVRCICTPVSTVCPWSYTFLVVLWRTRETSKQTQNAFGTYLAGRALYFPAAAFHSRSDPRLALIGSSSAP